LAVIKSLSRSPTHQQTLKKSRSAKFGIDSGRITVYPEVIPPVPEKSKAAIYFAKQSSGR
jgi:hypothetical protein